jgi:hypothetical protein
MIVSTLSQCSVMGQEDGVEPEGSSGLAVAYSFRKHSGKPMLG